MRQPNPPRPSVIHFVSWSPSGVLLALFLLVAGTIAIGVLAHQLTLFERFVLGRLDLPVVRSVSCTDARWPIALHGLERTRRCRFLYVSFRGTENYFRVPLTVPSAGRIPAWRAPLLAFHRDDLDVDVSGQSLLTRALVMRRSFATEGLFVLHLDEAAAIYRDELEHVSLLNTFWREEHLTVLGEAIQSFQRMTGDQAWTLWIDDASRHVASQLTRHAAIDLRSLVFEEQASWMTKQARVSVSRRDAFPTFLVASDGAARNLGFAITSVLQRFPETPVRLLLAGNEEPDTQACMLDLLEVGLADDGAGSDEDCEPDANVAILRFPQPQSKAVPWP